MRENNIHTLIFFLLLIVAFSADAQNAPDSIDLAKFERVEVEATYPGGDKAWIQYLQKTLNPNVPVDNGAPIGKYTVVVQFIVDKEGNASDLKALTKNGYGMEAEVLRILRKSGKWTPAWQNGRIVKAYRKQPVTFIVEDESIAITSRNPYTLYTNLDNAVSVSVNKVKAKDLVVTLSGGTIIKDGDDNYIIKVNEPGKRVLMTIKTRKNNKTLAVVSFDVQQGPM